MSPEIQKPTGILDNLLPTGGGNYVTPDGKGHRENLSRSKKLIEYLYGASDFFDEDAENQAPTIEVYTEYSSEPIIIRLGKTALESD